MEEVTELRKIFTNNLNHFISLKQVTQKELATYMQVSPPTVNDWIKGRKLPRMDKVDKLCQFFNIQRSDLISAEQSKLNQRDTKEISQIIEDTRQKLLTEQGLMFDGTPASEESIQSIIDAMQIGMEMAKLRNKEKYTPKKFRK